jgi:hypothetical protein
VGTLPPAIGNLTNLLELWALHNCTSFIYNWVILCHICKLNTKLPHWALSGAHFGVSLCALFATYIELHNFACIDRYKKKEIIFSVKPACSAVSKQFQTHNLSIKRQDFYQEPTSRHRKKNPVVLYLSCN